MSEFKLVPFKAEDLVNGFEIYKQYFYKIVEQAFGWDEEFQKHRFAQRYELSWFQWIHVDNKNIGYVCSHYPANEIHISLLIIYKEFQKNNYGSKVMEWVRDQALKDGRKVTLSSFKNNQKANSFYQKLGYSIYNQDQYFYDFIQSR